MIKFIKDIYYYLTYKGFFNWIPSKLLLKIQFRFKFGEKLDLQNPKTFNEKMQWLKLYGNLEKHTNLVDKFEVREYIAETIGEEFLIPLLGVWDKFEDIDFDKLPNRFVLKCTHDSGSVLICKDKITFNKEDAMNKLNKHLKQNFYYAYREPQYKNVRPRIICEKYMVDDSGEELKDYKFFCFDGEPKIIQLNYDRFIDHKLNYYDSKWNYIPIKLIPHPTDINRVINKPNNLEQMLKFARILSRNISFVRVDVYSINDNIYFGEMTFTPNSGFKKFEPHEFDLEMGSWLKLPMR